MRKNLNTTLQLITPILLMFLSVNLSFAQKGMDLQDDDVCTTQNLEVSVFPFDNDDLTATGVDLSSFNIISAPNFGTAVWDAYRYILTYTPNAGVVGPDQLIYELCNSSGDCSEATITIDVQDISIVPMVDIFTYETASFSGNVISNDNINGLSSSDYTVVLVSGPTNGSVVLQTNGDFTYTQNPNYLGKDYFVYEVCDVTTSYCAESTVALHAMEIPADADNYALINDFGLTFNGNTNLINYSLDRNNSIVNTDGFPVVYNLLSTTSNGSLFFNANGTFSYLTAYDYVGKDAFSYEVCIDGNCTTAQVFIDVLPENFSCRRHFPVALNNTVGVCNIESLEENFRFNDLYFGYYDDLEISILNGPEHGTLHFDQEGNFTYLPVPEFEGIDRIEYEICEEDISVMTYDYTEMNTDLDIALGTSSDMLEESIMITEAGVLSDFNITVELTHDALEELQLNLVHPNGTVIPLASNICTGSGTLHLIFKDGAATNVNCGLAAAQEVSPLSPLADVLGTQIAGEWKLQLIDNTENDNQGVLSSWGMETVLNPTKERDCRTAWIEIPVISKTVISLDLELLDFKAQLAGDNTVELQWISNEYGEASDFLVERSQTGFSDWKVIGKVDAKNVLAASYAFSDKEAASGKNYYRLLKRENNGAQFYSDIRVVEINDRGRNGLLSSLTDNRLIYSLDETQVVEIEIFNTAGQRVRQLQVHGTTEINIEELQTGMYISVMHTATGIVSEKFFVK